MAKKIKMVVGDRYELTWADHKSIATGWIEKDDKDFVNKPVSRPSTMGYFYKETEAHYILSHTIDAAESEYADLMYILKIVNPVIKRVYVEE
jgi:hypothetical protein